MGLVYDQARWYDPITAQFLSADPLFSQTGQAYSYAGSDPINASDPSGLSADDPFGIGNDLEEGYDGFLDAVGSASQSIAKDLGDSNAANPANALLNASGSLSDGQSNSLAYEVGSAVGEYTVGKVAKGADLITSLEELAQSNHDRANDLASSMDSYTQSKVTIASGTGIDSEGNIINLISSSDKSGYVSRSIQDDTDQTGGTVIRNLKGTQYSAHAEVRMINYANENNIDLLTIGASHDVCLNCENALNNANLYTVTPLKGRP